MGYRVILGIAHEYGPRKGLEGPWQFGPSRVLYYDPSEGKYYDPRTDFYVEQDEMDVLHQYLYDHLAKEVVHG